MSAVTRRAWALGYIQRCLAPPPRYGSMEWQALPDSEPEKVAACVIAAEAWAMSAETLEQDLCAQLDAEVRAHKRGEDEDYQARALEHRKEFGGLRIVRGAYADSPEFLGGDAS